MAKRQTPEWLHQFVRVSRVWIFTFLLIAGLTLIYSFNIVNPTDLNIVVGQPVADDVIAPRTISYESEALTNAAIELAILSVNDEYTPIDTEIGREQLNLARSIFSFVDVVRADLQATNATKLIYLQAITPINIDEANAELLLTLNVTDYDSVKTEILRIVGELMREEIFDVQVSDFRRRASREAPLDFTEAQTVIITNLAPQFIVPNRFYDDVATEQARAAAVSSVEPQIRTISKNQRILRSGDIVREEDREALIALGLLEQETDWKDVASVFIIVVLMVVVLMLYWQHYHRRHWLENSRYLTSLFILLMIFALSSRVFLSGSSELVYWFPIASLAMMLTVVFEERFAIISIIVMSVLYGYAAPNSLELMLYCMAGGIMATLTISDAQRINALFRAGFNASVGYIAVIVLFQFTQNNIDVVYMMRLMLFAIANGILSAALALVGFYLMGNLLGLTTTIQLQDLSRLDHELLQELLRRAPGTYHHSIMLANLAEQAGEEIKANTALIRVGAFYHDIGKMNRPPFFTENQEGVNPHDSLDPYTSARIILSHVTEGIELAKKYRLPDLIRSFIEQHHGTKLVKGFYHKAKEQAKERDGEEVDPAKFRYPGPRPQTQETAIVLMADAIESASRALQPDTPRAIEKLVNSLIDEDLAEGQLDESGLTLGDIRKIRASFIKTLKGRFHVRVKYPGNEQLKAEMDGRDGTGTEAAAAPSLTEEAIEESVPPG